MKNSAQKNVIFTRISEYHWVWLPCQPFENYPQEKFTFVFSVQSLNPILSHVPFFPENWFVYLSECSFSTTERLSRTPPENKKRQVYCDSYATFFLGFSKRAGAEVVSGNTERSKSPTRVPPPGSEKYLVNLSISSNGALLLQIHRKNIGKSLPWFKSKFWPQQNYVHVLRTCEHTISKVYTSFTGCLDDILETL